MDASLEERRIDDLDLAESVSGDEQIPFMKDGVSKRASVTQISTKVQGDLAGDLDAKAPLHSPAFTGNPTAPTPSVDDDDTSIPNTGWVQDEIADAVAISPLTEKTTLADADLIRIADSEASNQAKKVTFASLWEWIRARVLTLFNVGGNAPVYAARAWVNFNGGGTPSVRASANVLGITDNGVGDWTVNLQTAMPNANYCLVGTAGNGGGPRGLTFWTLSSYLTTTSCRVRTVNDSGTVEDGDYVSFVIFG